MQICYFEAIQIEKSCYNEPYSSVIIDDERYACERLKKLLVSCSQIIVLESFTSSEQGLKFILKQKPELIFLDVELEKNESAFDLINELSEYFYHPHIIFVTAFPHYSIKAIKKEVFDYDANNHEI